MKGLTVKSLAFAFAAVFAAAFVLPADAEAGPRKRSGQWVGPKGGVHNFHREYNRQPGSFYGKREYNNSWGGAYRAQRQGTWGDGKGQTSLNRERQFRDGTTRTFNRDRNWDREAGTFSRHQERTYRDGSSTSSSRNITRLDDGAYGVEGTFTNRQGETHSYSGTVTKD